jgi:cellulose synthase/poly-beta-1,6-N-acetylglucosamine synthase-like glycosyltransferase
VEGRKAELASQLIGVRPAMDLSGRYPLPRVSVITPAYNAGRFLGDTIESVRRQNFEDW